MSFKVGFCVSGKGRLAMSAIRNAQRIGIKPCILIAEHTADQLLESFCCENEVNFVRIPKLPRVDFDQKLYESCTKQVLDLVCLTFDKIVAPRLVEYYKGRIINVHPALLPAFIGTKALERAESTGVRFAGATIHEVVEEVDAGAIVAQCLVSLGYMEKYNSFGFKIYKHLEPMFLQTLNWYATGRVFKDEKGRIWVRNAVYGGIPISPEIEIKFPE